MSHKPNGTQQQRILQTLQALLSGEHDIPEQYLVGIRQVTACRPATSNR
jgi:hypothetical protein